MHNIFIIHGSYGNPQENWFPWLKNELEKDGQKVFVPQFPLPKVENPAWGGHDLEKWIETIDGFKNYINKDTIFVAHSRGCVFLYHFLPHLKIPVAAAFLVAPWMTYHWYPVGWTDVDSFHKKPFEWEKIKHGSRHFNVFQSTNDDTPVSEGKKIAQKLGAELTVVENAGHFNTSAGYTKFPLLSEKIRECILPQNIC